MDKATTMKYEINNANLGDWAISRKLLEAARQNIPAGGTILELGSGTGTLELRKFARVISIEHDKRWAQPEAGNSRTFIVPIDPETGWYSRELLHAALRGLRYDLIIVDGPKRTGRHGFLHNLDLFDHDAVIIIDDTHREHIAVMTEMVARALGRTASTYHGQGEKRTFAVFKKAKKVV